MKLMQAVLHILLWLDVSISSAYTKVVIFGIEECITFICTFRLVEESCLIITSLLVSKLLG